MDEDEEAVETDSDQGWSSPFGPCVYEPFFSGKICMQGLCMESASVTKCSGICSKTSKHMKTMDLWSGRKDVLDQAKAALDYIAHRQGSPSGEFDIGLDCFDISASVCIALQPGEMIVFKFTIGWKLPGSCFHGLKGLVENHIYLNFDVCIGTGLAWLKGPLSAIGLDCFNLVSIKIYLSIGCIHVEITASLIAVRGVITGQAALGPMANGLISDYCFSISGGQKTCYKKQCKTRIVYKKVGWINLPFPEFYACSNMPYKCANNKAAYDKCYKKYEDMRKAQIKFSSQWWKPYVRYNRRRRWLGSISAGGTWTDVFKPYVIDCSR